MKNNKMEMAGGPKSVNLKLILLVIAIIISISTLFFTQNLVEKIQKREKDSARLYAQSLEQISSEKNLISDQTFFFNVIQNIDFPLILTDQNDNFSLKDVRNINIDTTLSEAKQIEIIKKKLVEFRKLHEPVLVTVNDTIIIQKIYFGESEIITMLTYYPFIQILVAIIFILIAYISFSYMKRNEQSNLWVGMSKETAHQLGTPISSLMGWSELLRISYKNPDKVLDISHEMDNDLSRLNKIAQRFSKIGSKPELKPYNVYDLTCKVIEYFKRRLPQLGKNVQITIEGNKSVKAMLNPELFEWVLENLIKNALDAMERNDGKINFKISSNAKSAEILVSDTGKGIDKKRRKDIFRPGYSTKRRGWGLGLSLSKRIVCDYHMGKIFVSESELQVGTTFKIILTAR